MISFKGVTLGYSGEVVLKSLNFEIGKNDFVGIIGQNGSGKTTILKAITGLIKPVSGKIVRGEDLQIGYVIQRKYLDTIFPLTVEDVVLMGRYKKIGILKSPSLADRQKVIESLEMVGIPELLKKQYSELSGGQRQRVLIARALVGEPNLLLLDEPTNDLDIKGEEQILKLIEKLHSQFNLTVILVSHLLHTVLNRVHRIIFLKDKKAKVYLTEEIFSEKTLSEIYEYPLKIATLHNRKYVIPELNNGNT